MFHTLVQRKSAQAGQLNALDLLTAFQLNFSKIICDHMFSKLSRNTHDILIYQKSHEYHRGFTSTYKNLKIY